LPCVDAACPPDTFIQPKRTSLTSEAKHVRVARGDVARGRRQRSAEAGHQRFLQRARAVRLPSSASKVLKRPKIWPAVRPADRCGRWPDRAAVVTARWRSRFWTFPRGRWRGTCCRRRRDRIDPAGGNAVAGERVQTPVWRRSRIADRESREVAARTASTAPRTCASATASSAALRSCRRRTSSSADRATGGAAELVLLQRGWPWPAGWK
jgi:hypothetical protein